MEYFKALTNLLNKEREEDLKNYLQLTKTSSSAERRANGLTWYPVAIRNTEMSRGDYLTVELERTTHHDLSHSFRFGASAALFSNHDTNDRLEGTISYQKGNRLKITLKTDELPDWARDGKLGVDVLFDSNSYKEMENALKQATALGNSSDHSLAKLLTGIGKPQFKAQRQQYVIDGLNVLQQVAVDKILDAQELAVVHGPPGTGKTTTLVQAIKALLKQDNKQILVVAPSNTAVDLLTEKLHEEGVNILRIGNPARVSDELFALTLDGKMAAHPRMKQIRTYKKQANEYKNMAHKYKRSFGRAEREQRKALFDEAYKIMRDVENTEQFIMDDLLGKAQVITATLIGANHYAIRKLNYHTVVIDEAGQALEPACWVPLMKARKVVFAGDHCQLSPTIKSNEAAKLGLATTLFEKVVQLYPESVVLLEEQYRMNEAIMGYSSAVFYNNQLKANSSVANRLLLKGDQPLIFIDTAGCGFSEKQEGTSITNPDEANFLLNNLERLVIEFDGKKNESDPFPSIAVISPYRKQVALLKDKFADYPALQVHKDKISVNTIDSFQGQERDVVYISMTRSNEEGIIGFLSDIRRMNVAMTRAKKKLVVIGDSATLSRLSFYANFIDYAEKKEGYHSAWEFME